MSGNRTYVVERLFVFRTPISPNTQQIKMFQLARILQIQLQVIL